jgi:hypothetical protein
METLDVTVTDVPADITRVTLGASVTNSIFGGDGPPQQTFMPPMPTTSATFFVPRSAGTGQVASYSLDRNDLGPANGGQAHARRLALSDTATTSTADVLPWVADAGVDFVQPAVTLQTTGSTSAIATIFAMHNTRSSRSERTVDWQILAPGTASRIELPRLPAPFQDWMPLLQAEDFTDMSIDLYTMDIWPTYREVVGVNSDDVWATTGTALRDLGANDVGNANGYIFY